MRLDNPDRYTENIYADAATDYGDKLARKLYFSPLYSISDTAYVLDLRKTGISKVVRTFQECLKQKALKADGVTDSKDGRNTEATTNNYKQHRKKIAAATKPTE